MATVAMLSNYFITRDSGFEWAGLTNVTVMDDNTPRLQQVATSDWVTIGCQFTMLTLAEKNTLVAFIQANAMNTITWTIDGVNYSGVFKKGHRESMSGPRYNISLDYYAKKV